MFALVTWQVAVRGPLLERDVALSARLRSGGLPDGVAEVLADLGAVVVAVPVLAVVAGVCTWWARRTGVPRWWAGAAGAGVLLVLVPLLVVPLKAWLARPGPPPMPGTGYYPSGHTATAVVAYGAAVALLWCRVRSAGLRWSLGCAGLVLVAGTGYGLVRRGYHWPLDVVASAALFGALGVGYVLFLHRWGGRGTPGG
ncbi:phosphatase PAP2 family protein [Streptomyces sp. NPDC002490]|uniref:phosphatase PAP2 family protein n=1 Tax=Streptomyces sp. NPDC002490 TaxID=3154416 RepID=UPI0033323074